MLRPTHRLLQSSFKGQITTNGDQLTYKITRSVPYKTSKFISTVKQVNEYQEFLPFCEISKMSPFRERHLREEAQGTLHIGFGSITDKYTSRVIYSPDKNEIKALNLDGNVFKKMSSNWTFKDTTSFGEAGLEHGTEYTFQIDCTFGNPIYSKIGKAAFPKVSEMMVKSFENRVKEKVLADKEKIAVKN